MPVAGGGGGWATGTGSSYLYLEPLTYTVTAGGTSYTAWVEFVDETSATAHLRLPTGGTVTQAVTDDGFSPGARRMLDAWRRVTTGVRCTPVETARARELRDAQEAQWQADARRRQDEAENAWRCAEALLLSWLTPQQRADYGRLRRFDVRGSDGRRYRIWCSSATGNVGLLGEDGATLYCAHPDYVPNPDAWLAQALALQTDARMFMDIANEYGHRDLVGEEDETQDAAVAA